MQKNVASQKIQLFVFDTATNLGKAGDAANITAYVAKDHGTVTVLGDTSATEMDATNAKGVYLFDLTQAETNADELTFTAKSTTGGVTVAPRFISTTPPNFSTQSIDSSGRAKADLDTIKTQAVTAAAGVTFPTSIASPTNITAGTITTVTNLTNAATAGDFTATMKTSIGTAVAASAVASVTGNVGGSVASVTARVTANTDQLAGQTVTAAAGVTFPTSVASPTNITAGTITTVTNLTNAATAGDFTATMKTSIGTAVAASAVASVTGNVGGNVVGSVGSVTGFTPSDVTAIKTVTDKVDDTLEDSGGGAWIFTVAALANGPSGGGGSTDWTTNERTAIRAILGIPGSGTTPADPSTGILDTIRDAALAVKAKTDNLPSDPADASDITAQFAALSIPSAIQNADALLNRDMSLGTDSGSASVRTPRQALRFLRNKWYPSGGGAITITKEDDSTESWSGTPGTTPGADPITSFDPAGP